MSTRTHRLLARPAHQAGPDRRRRLFCLSPLALGATALLQACGGGGGAADTAAGGGGATPSRLALGLIAGFGSIIVNGVRYDDSSAQVFDDHGRGRSRDDLRLGFKVEIESGPIDLGTGSATAQTIRLRSEIRGPVERVDLVSSQLLVLGQTVQVSSTTVLDDRLAGGLATLQRGQWVEIHGQYDAVQGLYQASRVEREDTAPTLYLVRGPLTALDTVGRQFRMGNLFIDYRNITPSPSLTDGAWVRVELRTRATAGVWTALSVGSDDVSGGSHGEVEVHGRITDFTSIEHFSVNGLPVDASGASFLEGTAGVVLGAFVEVEGAWTQGVLQARKVSLEDHGDDDGSGLGAEIELHGTLSQLDASSKTFSLRGLTVQYAGPVVYRDGSEGQLANGIAVEVKGTLSPEGTQVVATRISFEN